MSRRVQFRQSGARLSLIVDGRLILEGHWSMFDELAAMMRSSARKAEEWDSAEAVARDNAILLRAGVPIGLSNNPAIRAETIKLAETDRDLRRYMPGGIGGKELFGRPTIFLEKPGVESA